MPAQVRAQITSQAQTGPTPSQVCSNAQWLFFFPFCMLNYAMQGVSHLPAHEEAHVPLCSNSPSPCKHMQQLTPTCKGHSSTHHPQLASSRFPRDSPAFVRNNPPTSSPSLHLNCASHASTKRPPSSSCHEEIAPLPS